MFGAKGCPVLGVMEQDAIAVRKQLPEDQNTKVFNMSQRSIMEDAVAIDLNNFSLGVDTLIGSLQDEEQKTACLFVGDAEDDITLGMGIACCVKSVQAIIKMRTLVEEGIMEKDMAEQLIKKSFEEPAMGDNSESYEIIDKILKKLDNGNVGKILADKVVDMCDAKVNLRKCIKTLKDQYEKSGENMDAKLQTIKAVELYFKLVCVSTYIRSEGEHNYKKTYSQWIKENELIEDTIEHGIRCWKDMTFFNLV